VSFRQCDTRRKCDTRKKLHQRDNLEPFEMLTELTFLLSIQAKQHTSQIAIDRGPLRVCFIGDPRENARTSGQTEMKLKPGFKQYLKLGQARPILPIYTEISNRLQIDLQLLSPAVRP
jgi:hypothetical protein